MHAISFRGRADIRESLKVMDWVHLCTCLMSNTLVISRRSFLRGIKADLNRDSNFTQNVSELFLYSFPATLNKAPLIVPTLCFPFTQTFSPIDRVKVSRARLFLLSPRQPL